MAKIKVSESINKVDNLYYIQSSLGEVLKSSECKLSQLSLDDRVVLTVEFPDYYKDIIKTEIYDKIAEVVAIKYKYDFFKSEIKLSGLSKDQKEIMFTGLIAADFNEDKRYSYERIKDNEEIAIDGMFNFKLNPLKRKWKDVVEYMPNCFFPSQLKDFIIYLKENRKKRVYVDNGKVFDSHYRRLSRCSLIGYERLSVVREVILTNCGEVEINGPLPNDDEGYLKEYYGNRIIFSTGYFN